MMTILSLNQYYKKLSLLFLLFINLSTAQLQQAQSKINSEDSKIIHVSPLEIMRDKREDTTKRTANSKHFKNTDGSYTAIIGGGPIHFQKNGHWEEINTKINKVVSNDYPFVNKSNLMETHFGNTLDKGIITQSNEGQIKEFLNPKMYWEVNGASTIIQKANNVAAEANNEKLYYKNIFGNISAEFIIKTGQRKLNYIIPRKTDLGIIPKNADYLVFEEEVILLKGWSYKIKNDGIYIINELGKEIFQYQNPISHDKTQTISKERNTIYEASLIHNRLIIKTKVKSIWLLESSREYPIKVDPTINVTPNNATNWSRSVYNDGSAEDSGYFGLVSGYWLQYHIKFNTSSIPTNINISSVVGWVNFAYGTGTNPTTRQWQFANSADPTTTSGTALYNSKNLGYSTIVQVSGLGVRSSTLYNPQGNDYVKNSIINNGYVAMTLTPSGTFSNNTYFQVSDHTSSNRPYLVINYTLISTDKTLTVTNADTGASYANGTYTIANNTSVTATSGTRTGYNSVGWIGTGSVPATGTGNSATFSISENSTINWQWQQVGLPNNLKFYNYGGTQQLSFNNSRHNSTTPTFRLSHATDPANEYEIEINTSPTFSGGTSWTQTFTGTYPINTQTNFTFNNTFSSTFGTTYYVRARVKGAANTWSSWTTETYSFTYETPKAKPDWFQTTQAQFTTDALSGTQTDTNHYVTTVTGGNSVVNGDFTNATASNNWTVTKSYSASQTAAIVAAGDSNCLICTPSPDRYFKIGYPWGVSSVTTGDNIIISQAIDLTNVNEVTFNIGRFRSFGGLGTATNVAMSFKIGGTLSNETGTTLYTSNLNINLSSNDGIIRINTSTYTGVQVIKFVVKTLGTWDSNTTAFFYISKVTANTLPIGTITSSPIYLSSVQGVSKFEKLKWNQTLDGGKMTLKIQQSTLGGTSWTDVPGYTNISATANGEQEFDLSAMTAYDQIRVIATLDGANVKLHDWSIIYEESCDKTWTGASSTDWHISENWLPVGIPTNKNCVNIPNVTNKPIINDNNIAYVKSLELQNDAKLLVKSNATIRVNNMIINHGNDDNFIIENNASLVQEDNITNTASISYKRNTSAAWAKDYIYISTPTSNSRFNNISNEPGYNFTNIYNWATIGNNTTAGYWNLAGTGVSATNPIPGVGYIARIPNNWTANSIYSMNFRGIPNNGDIQVNFFGGSMLDLTTTPDLDESLLDKWNLIGNPYPSAVDAYKFLNFTSNRDLIRDPANPTAETNGDGALYFWNHKEGTGAVTNPFYNNGQSYASDPNNHYIVKNFTGITPIATDSQGSDAGNWNGMIPTGQSFFMRSRPNINSNITFNNSMRVNANNDSYYKNNAEKHRYWLDFSRVDNQQSAQALIGYIENATDNLDYLFDGLSMDNELDLYSIVNHHHLVIQGKALPFNTKDVVQLGYKAPASGVYRIGLFKTEGLFAPNGTQKIFLKDKSKNTITNLLSSPYEFSSDIGRYDNRFEIIYEDLTLNTLDINDNDINILYNWNHKYWDIQSAKSKLVKLEVYDYSGKLIVIKQPISAHNVQLLISEVQAKTGIIKLYTIDGRIVTKKIINP